MSLTILDRHNEQAELEQINLNQEVTERAIPVSRGDIVDATATTLTNLDFQRRAFGTGTGLIVGEMVGEGARVTTGQTGLGGLLVKGAGRVGTGIASLWLGSMMPNDLQLFMEDVAIGSWAGFLVNVTNFASAGSPTTDLGATSQFAASMGARLRAAQLSNSMGRKKQPSKSVKKRRQLKQTQRQSDAEKSGNSERKTKKPNKLKDGSSKFRKLR